MCIPKGISFLENRTRSQQSRSGAIPANDGWNYSHLHKVHLLMALACAATSGGTEHTKVSS